MLGNLFAQKKSQDEPQATQQQNGQTPQPTAVAQQTPAAQSTSSSQPDVIGSSMTPSVRQDLSVMTHLDTRMTAVLHQAEEETKRIKQQTIEPEQVLFGLLYDQEIFQLLQHFSVDASKLSSEIQSKEKQGFYTEQPTLSDASKKILEEAYRAAKVRGVSFVTPEDVLVTLFSDASTGSFLSAQGVKKEQVEEKLSQSTTYTTGKKSVLERFGIDLTEEARAGKLDPIAGRDKEIDRLTHILIRRTKNNPIVIGEAGVGKTAIVEGLAEKIVEGGVPKELAGKRIFQLDIASLVAGASHRGEFEERLRSVINEAMATSGQTVLFIDEIHTLIGTGEQEGALDASNIIKPHLARGRLQIIGTTTTSEYRKHFEKDKAFSRRFQPVVCDEPSEDVAVEMLKVLKPKYEKYHQVVIPDETLAVAVKLSKKYIGERFLPDKAVDLIDEAAADVRLKQSQGTAKDNAVTKEHIELVVSNWTGIPVTRLTEDESAKLLELEKRVHRRLIDQEEAVTAVSEAVRRGRIGLASANRPIASFIFLGPTGVGKTELAKTLAEILFGKDDAMVRLDMSEYMEKHEVAKLIGAPPGYVGYEEGGQLTEAVRAKPYSIVLFDEVEKAHPDVFNMLLQLLEDGRLTDNKGNTISFKNTIVICTSNIGSSLIQQYLSEAAAKNAKSEQENNQQFGKLADLVSGELRKFFRPELLNRFDDVVIFKPLRKEDMAYITKLGIEKTRKLLKDQNLDLTISEKALVQLSEEGYDPVYGARPLRRLIQTVVENPIALLIIGKTFVSGDTILIDYDQAKGEFTFTKAQAKDVKQAETTQSSQPNNTGQSSQQVSSAQPAIEGNPPTPAPTAPPTPANGNGVMQQAASKS